MLLSDIDRDEGLLKPADSEDVLVSAMDEEFDIVSELAEAEREAVAVLEFKAELTEALWDVESKLLEDAFEVAKELDTVAMLVLELETRPVVAEFDSEVASNV